MNITGLKIPTGRRQTSWLFTSMTEKLNWGPPRNNFSLVVRAGLEPATSGFQVRRPNHSATLPPWKQMEMETLCVKCSYSLALFSLTHNNLNLLMARIPKHLPYLRPKSGKVPNFRMFELPGSPALWTIVSGCIVNDWSEWQKADNAW